MYKIKKSRACFISEFSESLHEMGTCLADKTTVDADGESGNKNSSVVYIVMYSLVTHEYSILCLCRKSVINFRKYTIRTPKNCRCLCKYVDGVMSMLASLDSSDLFLFIF